MHSVNGEPVTSKCAKEREKGEPVIYPPKLQAGRCSGVQVHTGNLPLVGGGNRPGLDTQVKHQCQVNAVCDVRPSCMVTCVCFASSIGRRGAETSLCTVAWPRASSCIEGPPRCALSRWSARAPRAQRRTPTRHPVKPCARIAHVMESAPIYQYSPSHTWIHGCTLPRPCLLPPGLRIDVRALSYLEFTT